MSLPAHQAHAGASAVRAPVTASPATDRGGSPSPSDAAFASDLERRTFDWFWESADPHTGLIPDRFPAPPGSAASIASVGFGLTAYGIGVKRGYITRDEAADRTLMTLRALARTPQNDAKMGSSGYHGFFYHFLDAKTGLRYAEWSELSSIDTALLMSGVLFAQAFYTADTPREREIRRLADRLYRRVDWPWMHARGPWMAMGWMPPGQFLPADWKGYNEGLIVYLQALGSPTHPLPASVWRKWTASYEGQWKSFHGHTLLNFAPLFGHQYSESWVDFRSIHDDWNRAHHTDYFQNSREAVYAQRDYARENPNHWRDYGAEIWGLTACDGPGDATRTVDGRKRHFLAYSARGAGGDYVLDDGTIAPTAAGGSVAFAPEIALPALEAMRRRYGAKVYTRYGFVDAFNPSFVQDGNGIWADNQALGIDQGPILLMIENWRSGFVWKVMKHSPYLRAGLRRAGFTDGWITAATRPEISAENQDGGSSGQGE
ncbi:glucoamylase family protein [Acidomonas methanolica]|uniref:Glycoamylase-like domain-containing protein n=2 Tax=Acidomonas methanolica TaxID=437 RepID=A0A023D249_ACIMT|nr:glucoamylase family protein [Acidomonas methanolica]MBU2655169.1 Tat pathway signal protein [Acidomonas methanolica]TCS24696.1 hypothetical protein EDC31_1226 [Acidomonas methanolica]GAJ28223.1 hypothetical protein Amme_016_006 [Acidomonas methanolica NBRC 104435]GEK98784.1 hypothetical protein AME01nite_12830 [Acidomonas methanolica NBRC 104435]